MLIAVLSNMSTLFSEASGFFSTPEGVQLNCPNEPNYSKMHSQWR